MVVWCASAIAPDSRKSRDARANPVFIGAFDVRGPRRFSFRSGGGPNGGALGSCVSGRSMNRAATDGLLTLNIRPPAGSSTRRRNSHESYDLFPGARDPCGSGATRSDPGKSPRTQGNGNGARAEDERGSEYSGLYIRIFRPITQRSETRLSTWSRLMSTTTTI